MPTDDRGPSTRGAYSNWPGVDETPGEVHLDRAKLRTLAKRLEAHLDELLSAKVVHAPPEAYGGWNAARTLYPSIHTGERNLADQHRRVLHALMEMIKKLHRTAQMSEDTEAELERRIANVSKGI
jgi:hypothetical protein